MKVSVFCQAYNHEKYIRKCLDGFVMQKTDFPFEVIIHDDASTDATATIIREYEEKYPNIIKPIYQTENQYSKGVKIQQTYMLEKAQGVYYAWCEGDDYWTDCNKLQKQVDFLDAHPQYSCCYHRVLVNNLIDGSIRYIPNIEQSRDYSLDEIVQKGAVFHLSALMMRKELYLQKPDVFLANGFGDIQLYMYGAICGKSHVLHNVMSTYNHGTEGSWTNRISKNASKNLEHEREMLAMLERVNAFYDYKYDDIFSYAIRRAQFNIYILSGDMKAARAEEYRIFYRRYKQLKRVHFMHKHFSIVYKIRSHLKGKKGCK